MNGQSFDTSLENSVENERLLKRVRENRKSIKSRRKERIQRENEENHESALHISIPDAINSRKGMVNRLDIDQSMESASSSEQLKSDTDDYFSCDSSDEDYDQHDQRTKLIKDKYNEMLSNTVVQENVEEENIDLSGRTKSPM